MRVDLGIHLSFHRDRHVDPIDQGIQLVQAFLEFIDVHRRILGARCIVQARNLVLDALPFCDEFIP